MTDREFVIGLIQEEVVVRAGHKKIQFRELFTGITQILDFDATEDEKQEAKNKIIDNVLKWFDVVTENDGSMRLERKQEE